MSLNEGVCIDPHILAYSNISVESFTWVLMILMLNKINDENIKYLQVYMKNNWV